MSTPGGLVDKQELIDAQLDTAHLGRVVNSKDASGAPISTSTNRTGGVNKTLDALEGEYQADIDNFVQVSDQVIVDKTDEFNTAIQGAGGISIGTWTSGVTTFNAYNEYAVYNGIPYKPRTSATLPYVAQGSDPTATPDDANVQPYQEITEAQVVALVESTIPELTDITYKASGGNSAIENMVAGVPVVSSIGDTVSTGGTVWVRLYDNGDINDFHPLTKINIFDIGTFRRLTRSEIISTEPLTDPELDATAQINAFIASYGVAGSLISFYVDGTFGQSEDIVSINKSISIHGAGIDVEGAASKWLPGRDVANANKGFFTVRGGRFIPSGDFRLIAPACYAPSHASYNASHTLSHAFNLLWRQEEGDRVNTTLSYSRIHIGRYDADGWGADFRDRECRQVKHGFITPNEPGFNNDGNNDFHQFDTVVMFHVDVAAKIENRQNVGWRFKNLQFFFGTSVDNLPVGGQVYYENLWIAGTTGVDGVFVSGTSGSTSEIARRYIHNCNAEGVRNDHFIEALGDSVVTKISGGGSIGFRTNEGAQAYCDLVKMKGVVRSDVRITGHQILEDTGSGDAADFRLRYDTNSKENNLFFDECWGDYFDSTSFQTGSLTGWSVQFRDTKPVAVNRRTDFSQNGSYSYLVNYSSDSALRDGFGRIPLSKIYDIGYMQQVSALAVGRLGVDSLTVVKSKTLRVKPTAATSFVVGNILEEGWRVIGIDAYFIYNDLGASYFSVESGDSTPFQFGSGVSNGSGADRISPLTGGDNGLLFVDNNRLRIRGFSDSGLTSPVAFSGSASGISDSTTIALTIHYIDLDRRYLDVDEYNKLDVTSGV